MTADNDSEELEALFDSIAAGGGQEPAGGAASGGSATGDVYTRLGQLTRQLYDAMCQLGYGDALERVARREIPDARERLAYIAEMSEQAAVRTLNAVEKIQPIQGALESASQRLGSRWDKLYEKRLSVEEFKRLSADTRDFMEEFSARTRKTNTLLLEIVVAQGFQDLTGQVIKKIFALARMMEQELLQLLVDAIPPEKKATLGADFLNGPVINPAGRDDVAVNQAQVDELLESLGF